MTAAIKERHDTAAAVLKDRHRAILASLADDGPGTSSEVHKRIGGDYGRSVTGTALSTLEFGLMVRGQAPPRRGGVKVYAITDKGLAAIGRPAGSAAPAVAPARKGRPPDLGHVVWVYLAATGEWSQAWRGSERACQDRVDAMRRSRAPGLAVASRPSGWTPEGDVMAARLERWARKQLCEDAAAV